MSTAHFRLHRHEREALEVLPKPLHKFLLAHHYVDELADLIQECALEVCKLHFDDELDYEQIFKTARSNVRRFTQDAAHYGQPDDFDTTETPANETTPLTRADRVREVADQQEIGLRAAQMRVANQIERTKRNGDLFLDDGEGER